MNVACLFALAGAALADTATAEVIPPLTMELRIPLSALHFLEFAIWGAWWVVLGQYLEGLHFSRKAIGNIYATMSLGLDHRPDVRRRDCRSLFCRRARDGRFATDRGGAAVLPGPHHPPAALLLGDAALCVDVRADDHRWSIR